MTGRPKGLDLFSGAGGSSMGYHRAGFAMTGVDLRPQKHYPFNFIQADALEYVAAHGHEYAAIFASPPCQAYSRATRQSGTQDRHPDLLAPLRAALRATGRPYVIENVVGAPLIAPVLLCGAMFAGLQTYRHRLFECSMFFLAPPHPPHRVKTPRSNVYIPGMFMSVYGHVSPVAKAREVLGIDWPMTQREVTNAIPPAFTHFVGVQVLRHVEYETTHGAERDEHA